MLLPGSVVPARTLFSPVLPVPYTGSKGLKTINTDLRGFKGSLNGSECEEASQMKALISNVHLVCRMDLLTLSGEA